MARVAALLARLLRLRPLAGADSARRWRDAERARSRLELILGALPDAVFVLDRAWRVDYANAAASRYTRRDVNALRGRPITDVFPVVADIQLLERLRAGGPDGLGAHTSLFAEATQAWFELQCHKLPDGTVLAVRDITLQHETSQKLRQSQKLEALGQLTGGIAHDVNNLLTVILGNFEMLALGAEQRGEAGRADLELAEAGLRAGESATELIRRLLAFSRRQPLSPRVVDIGALLNSLVPILRRTLGEHVGVRVERQPALWRALVDPAGLENAILNLAINARDAMPNGGQLLIEASNVPIDRVYAAVAGLDRTGEFIMVSVADSGTGMSREVAAKAFDPFFTTKRPGEGTGLGLSLVHGFANQSGGHVLIDSELGLGTIVRLYLPRTVEGAARPASDADDDVPRGHETVLLVEDNEHVRAHAQRLLRGLGYAVVAVGDGPAALRMLAEGLLPDLLLTDVVLPIGMTGRDVAEAAAAVVPGLRVLLMSGYAGDVLIDDGPGAPGQVLIRKPFRRQELARRLRMTLQGPAWSPRRDSPWARPQSTL